MNENDLKLLKALSEAFSPSGYESEIRSLIRAEIQSKVDRVYVDPMGNLIAEKGIASDILICAHMDEVGFMVSEICEDGTLKISPVGGITQNSLPSKKIRIGKNKIQGVIGAKPIHLTRKEKKESDFIDLFAEIGASSKKEAELLTSVGDFAVFDTDFYVTMNGESVFGKALDNLIGCFLLCKLIEENAVKNGTFVFSVQEETGLRGAAAVADKQKFNFAIALDTTTANDLPGIDAPQKVCCINNGPVISYIDGATVYSRDLVRDAFGELNRLGISAQTKMKKAGGNDASALQKVGNGHKVLSLSVPCRYIHGPIGIASIFDIEESFRALVALSARYSNSEKKNVR